MNRTGIPILLWGSALGLLLAVLAHFAGVYVVLASLVLSATIFLIAVPFAAVAGGLWLWQRGTWTKRIARWSGALVLITSVQMGCLTAIRLFVVEKPPDSKAICDELIPQLEAYRTAQGSYPKTLRALDEFSALSTPLEIIETSDCSYYSADGKTFSLNVDEFWTSYWDYDSETKLWEYVD
ncbi:MAG: hypothetical protein AAGF01_30405 [Cyanobacteria bacterium P01_G01_bin.38]